MTGFKWVIRLRLLANLALATLMLYAPQMIVRWFDLSEVGQTEIVVQAVGVFYLFISMGYVASAFAPSKTKAANIFPLFAPILPIVFFFCLGGGFFWLALYELFFLVLIHLSFRRGFISELMALP